MLCVIWVLMYDSTSTFIPVFINAIWCAGGFGFFFSVCVSQWNINTETERHRASQRTTTKNYGWSCLLFSYGSSLDNIIHLTLMTLWGFILCICLDSARSAHSFHILRSTFWEATSAFWWSGRCRISTERNIIGTNNILSRRVFSVLCVCICVW